MNLWYYNFQVSLNNIKTKALQNQYVHFVQGPIILEPKVIEDSRGYFFESWDQKSIKNLLCESLVFTKDCYSFSKKGVLRGLHFQIPPFEQEKIISCISEEIFDVIVDLRKNSPTYKSYISLKLDENENKQLFIPKGFAHGFLTISSNAKVFYKISGSYSYQFQRSLKWDDKELNIKWPLKDLRPILSTRDNKAKTLIELEKEI